MTLLFMAGSAFIGWAAYSPCGLYGVRLEHESLNETPSRLQ